MIRARDSRDSEAAGTEPALLVTPSQVTKAAPIFSTHHRTFVSVFVLLLLLGALLRLYPSSTFRGIGYDEGLYAAYVNALIHNGATSYPDLAKAYVARQEKSPDAILPPTRFLYIFSAYLWHQITGADALAALHHVSCCFSILLLLAAGLFAWRLGGHVMGLAVLALMVCAPTQIHMAQHALIDGVFAFWATLSLWLLWENLRRPNNWLCLASYTLALALMVITKENAAFAYVGLVVILVANRWLRFGKITPNLLLSTATGPLFGLLILTALCRSPATLVRIYQLLVSKASVLPYAIATGDGPWYRYLVDLLLISPLVLILAGGALFRLRFADKPQLYLLLFVAGTYSIMCNIRYGMNLRYTNMWDMPLRYFATTYLIQLARSVRWHCDTILAGAIVLLCFYDLRQYQIFFVEHGLYELVTAGLLHALRILK